MNSMNKSHEKIWLRYKENSSLQTIATKSAKQSLNSYSDKNGQVNATFKSRLHMTPRMANGQHFIIQLVYKNGFSFEEIAYCCGLDVEQVIKIYYGRSKKWPSNPIFEKILRFYCVVLRHNLQPKNSLV